VIIFGSVRFLSKKRNQTEIFLKKSKPVQTGLAHFWLGLARFFPIWLGFFSLARFFAGLAPFFSVFFFRFGFGLVLGL